MLTISNQKFCFSTLYRGTLIEQAMESRGQADKLEDGKAGGREGGASRRGVAPARGVPRYELEPTESGWGRLLHQTTSKQWIKEDKQAVK